MKEVIIQAVDIGTTKVAAIVARMTLNNKLEILGIGTAPSYGVKRADVANIKNAANAVRTAVREAEKQSGIPFREVVVGVAGSHIKSSQHRAKLIRDRYDDLISEADLNKLKEDMHKLALPPGDSVIDIIPQDFTVDHEHHVKDPIGMPGSMIEGNYHVITGSTLHINNLKRCVEEAGLKVKDIILQPLASSAAVLSDEEKRAGIALIDIGGGTTDVAIFHDGVIVHTAVIPLGGEIITEDIKTICKILVEHAEKLKVLHGAAYPDANDRDKIIAIPGIYGRAHREISAENLTGIIQARMEDIIDYVIQEIDLSGMSDRLMGIVLTGGGSKLKHIVQLTEYLTGLEVRLGKPNEHLTASKVKDVDNPSYATGIGLIINDIGNARRSAAEVDTVVADVEKPTSVDNNGQTQPDNLVALEDKSAPDVKQPKTPEKPEEKPKSKGLFKAISDRFVEWMGDDFSDFK